jgi:uncharacterized protein YigA (DUF484 family)
LSAVLKRKKQVFNPLALDHDAMGSLHKLETKALASLRARLGAAQETNEDLIAFARGHQSAVATIHKAVLEAMKAADCAAVFAVVVEQWPDILGIDRAVLALIDGDSAILATKDGPVPIDPAILWRVLRGLGPVTIRNVARGHPLFGPSCALVRAEALVRIDCGDDGASGLLLLGQRHSPDFDEFGGSDLLRFLGESLAAMIGRWRNQATG